METYDGWFFGAFFLGLIDITAVTVHEAEGQEVANALNEETNTIEHDTDAKECNEGTENRHEDDEECTSEEVEPHRLAMLEVPLLDFLDLLAELAPLSVNALIAAVFIVVVGLIGARLVGSVLREGDHSSTLGRRIDRLWATLSIGIVGQKSLELFVLSSLLVVRDFDECSSGGIVLRHDGIGHKGVCSGDGLRVK